MSKKTTVNKTIESALIGYNRPELLGVYLGQKPFTSICESKEHTKLNY